MKIEIGQVAPDFTLYDSAKNKVTLSDLIGQNVLLIFFLLQRKSLIGLKMLEIIDLDA